VAPVVILVWVLCAVVGVFVGQSRGVSVIESILWCLFLGPVGLFMLAVTHDNRPKCPECGGAIVRGYARCRHCGSAIRSPNR
jgi:hypothetical protein